MYMGVFLYICATTMCAQYPQKPEESIGSLGTGVADKCWELNSGPLQEQQMPLTAKSSLQIPPIF